MEKGCLAPHPKKGLRKKARIGFSDEAAFSDKPMIRKTWALKGHTPIFKIPGGWTTRSVISAITCAPNGARPRLHFRVMKKAINEDRFILFLKLLKRHTSGKLILVIDNLKAHKSKKVRAHVKTQKSWLDVEYLPAYAPELNPVEYLWSSRKRKHFANASIKGGRALDRRIRKNGNAARRDPNLLKGFLKASSLF